MSSRKYRHRPKPPRLRGVATLLVALTVAGCGQETPGETAAPPAGPVSVVFLAPAAETGLDAEAAAALAWLRSRNDFDTSFVQLADLANASPSPASVLWWHHAAAGPLPSAALAEAALETVRAHLSTGGALMLSLLASPWVVPLGLETVGPNEVGLQPGTHWARWGPDDDRILAGMQSYRGHPLLRPHWGTILSTWMRPSEVYASAAWTNDIWPANGKVVAIGRRYIGLDPDRRTVVEYDASAARSGHVLAIGEGLYFADEDNPNRAHAESLAADALGYLGGHMPPAPAGSRIATHGAPALMSGQDRGRRRRRAS
ncbi:MAG: hypothetical protein GKS06_18445 [Acidobacteria bacterium]|nr:hypothetical protein [Acidobacteriota bacterium]